MIFKSIFVQFKSEVDRFKAIKVLNRNICPRLQKGFGLIEADVLDIGPSALLMVFNFDQTMYTLKSDSTISEFLKLALVKEGVELSLEQFITRSLDHIV
jgi:hypothetical protein